ncbi:MAG: thiosulfate/3-mercaptopyruvate sulfurtransferase [Chloroflexi bacterium]|nr:MAG: thiosulfate/3-mercaptopyruvate sulfurtransferase [Chloroflexota bacterium]MBA4374689.1 sulfurtransferase [Anaerolinea sp.]
MDILFSTIISTEELLANLSTLGWVIVDCRFDLSNPTWGQFDYEQFHIPGAVYANLKSDLSGLVNLKSGRHPLPDSDVFFRTCSNLGIDINTQVIVYDTTSGSMASRLWFLLKYYGHNAVGLLDGGFVKWLADKNPTESGFNKNKPAHFKGKSDPSMIISSSELMKIAPLSDYMIIDARAPERYTGKMEPIDPVAGRIPGAVNRFHGNNLDKVGMFLPQQTMKEGFLNLLNGVKPENAVVYCGSGVTSCLHLVAMAHAGIPLAKLYAGSWSEWISDPANPITKDI